MDARQQNTQPWIVVGAITRQRPRMFADLLQSFGKLEYPKGATVTYCFAENADQLSVQSVVDEFTANTDSQATLLLEPQLGIPFARNAVLDWALSAGADYLTFVDDDERVDTKWLSELFSQLQREEADLVGGPIHPVSQVSDIGFWDSLNLDAIKFREDRKSKKALNNLRSGKAQKITVATNNWMCRLKFVRDHNLRFDESIGQSSGSDSVFSQDLKSLGGKVSWAEKAVVYEVVPESRLKSSYQYRRARETTLTTFRTTDKGRKSLGLVFRRISYVLWKMLLGVLRLIISPLNKGRSIPSAVRSFGCAMAGLASLFNADANHYGTTDGN